MKKRKKKASSKRIIGEALDGLVVVWRETLKRPRRRALLVALALAFVVAMLVARVGTLRARIGGGAVLAAAIAAVAIVIAREERRWDDPRAVIARLAGRADPDRAARALRALTLLDEDGAPKDDPASTSHALARVHVARQLAALPHDAIVAEADRVARWTNVAAIALAVALVVLGGTHAFSVLEGVDVLVARDGAAPIGLPYVTDLTITTRPPEYLHQDERTRSAYGKLALPRGTLLTFRAEALHAGRRLVVTDGKNEVPFAFDGEGRVVARWPLADSVSLRIVARFGDVVVPEPEATEVTSIADEAPKVILEGAPKTISLASPDGKADIPIRYEVTDDHGLREVELVMTSGAREERRVLAKLDGETREDRGGSMLKPSTRFVRESHAPVLVRVEAKDNDAVTGPKWGKSEPITLLPPDVGEGEAARLDALRALRDVYVDSLAWRMENAPGKSATFLADEKRDGEGASRALDAALLSSGLPLPARLTTLLRTNQAKVDRALVAEQRAASAATHKEVVAKTETMVLVIDGIVRGLAHKDARAASKLLADVADDLAQGLADERASRDLAQAKARAEAAEHVLRGGQTQLARLGTLGRDLSGAVRAGLARVDRAGSGDLPHGELAARDLAERLRDADPSFGQRGGTGGHASGESGEGSGASGDEGGTGGEESEAERAFNEAAQDLEQLDQDHATEVGKAEQSLSRPLGDDDVKQMKEAAKPHAQAVRDAVKDLPTVGGGSDTWSSKGAAAREHAEQMARSLESGSPADAVESGKQARDAINEAKHIAARSRYRDWDDPTAAGAQKKLDDALQKLEPEIKWAEDQLEQMKKKAAERARGDLQKSGASERDIADRAQKLAEKSGRALPEDAVRSIERAERAAREAASALEQGDAENGTAKQREAQQALDAAKQSLGEQPRDEGELSGGNEGDGRDPSGGEADIPGADAHKGPEAFRKRVLRGLAEPSSSKNKDAIRRYAEGLLR